MQTPWTIFGLNDLQAIRVITDFIIHSYEKFQCRDCHLIHKISPDAVAHLVWTYPGTEAERMYLSFYAGSKVVRDGTYWTMWGITLSMLYNKHPDNPEQRREIIEESMAEHLSDLISKAGSDSIPEM